MTGWYTITPSGSLSFGNLTPVGQNSGQVGCRWPPNGHHLAACLGLTKPYKLWGPFWYQQSSREIYVTLPLPVYGLNFDDGDPKKPEVIYRLLWDEQSQSWQTQSPEHQKQDLELVGGRYLISGTELKSLWAKKVLPKPSLQPLPWETLTLSHNQRDNFQVSEEGGFFAEMTTLLKPGWSILVKIIDDRAQEVLDSTTETYIPSRWSCLGAGGTPVIIDPLPERQVRDRWLTQECTQATGAVLLTGALWQKDQEKVSLPYPDSTQVAAYAADQGEAWQTWTKLAVTQDDTPVQQISRLTPGEWLTPAGAVYLWRDKAPLTESGPLPDSYYRHTLGYGHLWLFEDRDNDK